MKAVITGGEGFIGKALAAALTRRGVEVISIDRKRGIEAKDFFGTVPDLHQADCVFHLAAQTSVFNTDKQQIIRDNIETFISVCDACRSAGAKLVYASSSTANGFMSCHFRTIFGQFLGNKLGKMIDFGAIL